MSPIVRWCKFNLVGFIGVPVQLAALALFNRCMSAHPLCATFAAVQIALLHNFAWHRRFTWRERRHNSTLMAQLLRFQLSNGLVSMVGNLTLVRVLSLGAGLPLLASNGLAILCCSTVNFCLGNSWAFPQISVDRTRIEPHPSHPRPSPTDSLPSRAVD